MAKVLWRVSVIQDDLPVNYRRIILMNIIKILLTNPFHSIAPMSVWNPNLGGSSNLTRHHQNGDCSFK